MYLHVYFSFRAQYQNVIIDKKIVMVRFLSVFTILALNAVLLFGAAIYSTEARDNVRTTNRDDGKRILEDYYDGEEAEDVDDITYYEDEEDENKQYKWRGEYDDDFIHHYKETTKGAFYEIFNTSPSEYNGDQWTFFAALMTLFSVSFCCVCMIFVIPCVRRRPVDLHSRNKNGLV